NKELKESDSPEMGLPQSPTSRARTKNNRWKNGNAGGQELDVGDHTKVDRQQTSTHYCEDTHQENWLRRSFRCGLDMATITTTWHGFRPPLLTIPNAHAATGDRHPNTYCSSADTTYPNAKSFANKSNHSPL